MAGELIDLEDELRALGRDLAVPTTDLAGSVLARLAGAPAPAAPGRWSRTAGRLGRWGRARWRALVAVLVGGLVVVGVATPVGATVARWFTFGGVEVVQGPLPPGMSSAPAATNPTAGSTRMTLAAAGDLVGFTPKLPTALGPPTGIEVSADRRVLSLLWPDGLRLDEFIGSPAPIFVKKYAEAIQFTSVDGTEALWFAAPHELLYVDADGRTLQEPARTAAQTLLWTDGPLTLRLEGAGGLDRAVQIAGSVE